MSVFDENITNGHPFDGVQNMDPVEGLDYVFRIITGEDFKNIVYQYKRIKTNKEGLFNDMFEAAHIIEQFHPGICVKYKQITKYYSQKTYIDSDGNFQREFPDEPPIFLIWGYDWIIIQNKSNISHNPDYDRFISIM